MGYHDFQNVTFRSISTWPGERTSRRQRSPFKAGWSDTLALMKTELRNLGAKNIVIELEMDASQLRNDGYPRADARSRGPGVILSIESKFGPLRYPCDRFYSWEDNIRAIALSLEKLRAVDRYGVTKRGEQYKGWGALPPAGGTAVTMDVGAAAAFMAAAAKEGWTVDDLLSNRGFVHDSYIAAAKRLHPDAGGNTREFWTLGEAKRALDLHHGTK